ncbi:MAG: hypothetical protein HN413_04215 [Chloroflexi bacterium]|jgi:hypothetical protein|nr:hypothetical protein [Chloroflexota bacterium]
MKPTNPKKIEAIISVLLVLILATLACEVPGATIDTNAAATAVQQTVQAAAPGDTNSTGGLQPIDPAALTATSIAAANPPISAPAENGQAAPMPTATTQNYAQSPAASPTSSSGNVQPTSAPPTTAPPPAQGAAQPSSATSSYVELYDYYDSKQGVDLDNGGGLEEMAYMEYNSSDPNPGHALGQLGGRGTVWADVGTTSPTYQSCTAIMSWYPGLHISKGHYYCYITDQNNYGYLRVDRLEQIGTGGSELQPWVLGVSFTTWLP